MKTTYKKDLIIRLDKYLTEKYSTFSRSQLQKLIKNGDVLVNDKKVLPHHFLKNGDKLILPDILKKDKVETPILKPVPNDSIKLDIVEETDDYLVINKPAGLLVHPTNKNETDTLVNALLSYYPSIENVGDTMEGKINQRSGIVHRLDRDVSGVMVIAKTQKMFEWLKNQFMEREVKKEYLGLSHGIFNKSSDTIDLPIGQSVQSGKMAARPKDSNFESKPAITLYEVLEQFQQYALLRVEIKTGRTHQIRVHLNAISHPVVGDQIYKSKSLKTRVKLNRIFLHAQTLGFVDLDKQWQEFKVEMPEGLKDFLNKLS